MITAVKLVICYHTNLLYTIIDCILYAILYIAVTYLFCDWKFIPFNLPRLFDSSLIPFPAGNPPV